MVLIKLCTSVMKLNKQSIMVIIHVQLVHIELFKLYVLSAMVVHVIHVQGYLESCTGTCGLWLEDPHSSD